MPKIYLLRSCESQFDLEQRLGGDSELTEKGRQQASAIADILKDIKLEIIYCSMLKRSYQTAVYIQSHHLSAPLMRVNFLNEVSAGSLDTHLCSDFERLHPDLFRQRQHDPYSWPFPGGESYFTATERVAPFIDMLKKKKGNYALVGHEHINKAIIGYLFCLSKNKVPFISVPADAVYEIDLFNVQEAYYIKGTERKKGIIISGQNPQLHINPNYNIQI